jgi:GMP synthase (glutamine-hydrolysing)
VSRRLLVLQHEDEAPAGWLGERWLERGLTLDVWRTDLTPLSGGQPAPRLDAADALVVLGGAMGANDDEQHDWLPLTKDLVVRAVAADLPFLGICLGHQIAAVALGGRVAPNPAGRTYGTRPLGLTPAGRHDRLLASLHGAGVTHYNSDVVTRLPEGAVELATTADGFVQAARFGPRAWGVQFHPEVTPEDFASWIASFTEPDEDLDPGATLADVMDAAGALRHTGRVLADAFAGVVEESASGVPGRA